MALRAPLLRGIREKGSRRLRRKPRRQEFPEGGPPEGGPPKDVIELPPVDVGPQTSTDKVLGMINEILGVGTAEAKGGGVRIAPPSLPGVEVMPPGTPIPGMPVEEPLPPLAPVQTPGGEKVVPTDELVVIKGAPEKPLIPEENIPQPVFEDEPPLGTSVIPSNVIDFMNRELKPITIPKSPEEEIVDPNAPAKARIFGRADIDKVRTAELMGSKLYGSPDDIGAVTVKEMLQNSYDAIKNLIIGGFSKGGRIDIKADPKTRVISVLDDGTGMTQEILSTKFLEIAGTSEKENMAGRPSGGFGIAKMLWMFENQRVSVTTMRNGVVSTMESTGPEIKASLEPGGKPIPFRLASSESKRP